MKKRTTILSVGDKKDFDSYRKFQGQRHFIRNKDFVYKSIDFERLFSENPPVIKNGKVIVFIFFPFKYWDEHIERGSHRGVYGNLTFYNKFTKYGKAILKRLNKIISADETIFVNNPEMASYYRDKFVLKKVLAAKGVNVPSDIRSRKIKYIERYLQKGGRLFIKPRCGSMGKGITYLEKGQWQTNFDIRRNKIANIHSDYGWVFRDVTGNVSFLRELLEKDVIVEEAVDPLRINGRIVDFRVYGFFDKVLYIYPRKGQTGAITTNISQGAEGSPRLRSTLAGATIKKIEDQVISVMKALDLNFVGVDVMLNKNKTKAYVVDVNMFPGFPRIKTFNIPQSLTKELSRGIHMRRSM